MVLCLHFLACQIFGWSGRTKDWARNDESFLSACLLCNRYPLHCAPGLSELIIQFRHLFISATANSQEWEVQSTRITLPLNTKNTISTWTLFKRLAGNYQFIRAARTSVLKCKQNQQVFLFLPQSPFGFVAAFFLTLQKSDSQRRQEKRSILQFFFSVRTNSERPEAWVMAHPSANILIISEKKIVKLSSGNKIQGHYHACLGYWCR